MKYKFAKDSQIVLDDIFVNHLGVLCIEIGYPKLRKCIMDVYPVIDGYNVRGELININDFKYVSHGFKKTR